MENKGYILGFWRNVKTRCKNPECRKPITRSYNLNPRSYEGLPESIKEIAPMGDYCPHCAKKMTEAVITAIKEEEEKGGGGDLNL